MTTIIAIEGTDDVVLGWDTQITVGIRKVAGGPKVFVNGGIIFGFAGDVLDANILQHATLPDPAHAGWDVDRWVTRELIPAMQAALNAREATEKASSKVHTGTHSLTIVNGRIYEISTDLAWIRSTDGIYAVGSGSYFALGALHAGANPADAMTIAARLDTYTGPTTTITTANKMLNATGEPA